MNPKNLSEAFIMGISTDNITDPELGEEPLD